MFQEILRDIGVTVMGDIIAILRHAKQVHAQAEREKVANALALIEEQDDASETTPSKKSTAASRMVDQWINNQRITSGTKSPVSGTESPICSSTKKRLSVQAASTYEPAPKVLSKSLSDRFRTIQQAAHKSTANKKKISPKMQKISIRLPNDKKVATKQKQTLAAKQKQAATNVTKAKPANKISVFDRLGEEQQSSSKPEIHPPSLKPLKTSVASLQNTKTSPSVAPNSTTLPTSVFSRLGNLSENTTTQPKVTVQAVLPCKRPQNMTSGISDEEDCDEGIDYTTHSVLRPPRQKQTVKVKPVKPVKPVKRTVGVVSQNKEVNSSKSVFSRLGP
ncbi:hypothetical protein QZH41_017000 [Actinostola sp. cb2023]|nr:hypothetical protein QZH41_017000 [Actinostola sp. cb2023]